AVINIRGAIMYCKHHCDSTWYIAKTLYGNDDDDDDDEEDTPKQNTMIEEPKLLGFKSANEKILLKSGPYGIYVQLGEDRKGYPPKRRPVPYYSNF
ncbi:DNA topoisomerase 1-like protein, partial [Trifolium pratense]